MKKVLLFFLQFFLFVIVYFAGSLFPILHLQRVLSTTPTATRIFIADGLVFTLVFYVLILLVELLTKRLRSVGMVTTLALLLAIGFGFFMKFGFLTRSAF